MQNTFQTRTARGFTLTEILIVIGLIVLVLALAVPAFNFITGARSIESARNQVAAMIGRARNEAVSRGAIVGVAFFRDPITSTVGMQTVIIATSDFGGAEVYQAWAPTAQYRAATGDRNADRVYALVLDATEGHAAPGKYVVARFDAISDNLNVPPVYGGVTGVWGQVVPGTATALDASVEYLPPGVGLQLVNDARGTATDRYVQTGVIAFDEQGKFIALPFTITANSSVGQRLGGAVAGFTQLGVMLYENEQLAAVPGFTPGDYVYGVPTLQPGPTAYAPDEQAEEDWIQANALHLLIDRYTGNLTKVE